MTKSTVILLHDVAQIQFPWFPAVSRPLLHIGTVIIILIFYLSHVCPWDWEHFWAGQGSSPLHVGDVFPWTGHGEREGVWARKEACNSLSSMWTLDTVPYVILTHSTCQRADVWLVWRTNMRFKCVSVMLHFDLTPVCIYVHACCAAVLWFILGKGNT